MVKNVGCFFTGGYTESNSMLIFLKRINDNIRFKQFCPNRTRKRKGVCPERDLVDENSGLTDKALLRYVYEYLTENRKEFSNIDAIIIEDDLDGRFNEEATSGDITTKVSKRTEAFGVHCKEVREKVRKILEKDENFPVIQFYASPEIEAWFLSDWANSFGEIYGPKGLSVLNTRENNFFSSRFQPHIRKEVLFEYSECIENYGYFEGKYSKLSDKIIESFSSFKVLMGTEPRRMSKAISGNRELCYSKRTHGDEMLRRILPANVVRRCPVYFRESYDQLKKL